LRFLSLLIAPNQLGTGASPAQDCKPLAHMITNPLSGHSAHAKH
jgi:hypothetical protein